MRKLKILDLFSGIGGFSLGFEKTGLYQTVAFCEVDPYCKQLLQKHWKGVRIYDDIKKLKGQELKEEFGQIDIVTGGFPCQPFSLAGKQKGTNDDRYLWPEMFRVIKEVKPKWVVGENVKNITNIQDGMVFENVCTNLEGAGYEVQAFNIPAAGVGAPHQRERIWIVAHSISDDEKQTIRRSDEKKDRVQEEYWQKNHSTRIFSGTSGVRNFSDQHVENSRRTLRQGASIGGENENEIRKEDANKFERSSQTPANVMANTESIRSREPREFDQTQGSAESNATQLNGSSADGAHSNIEGSQGQWPEHELCESEGETPISWPRRWEFEPDVGRVANGVQGRVHRLKALGNSIVPQIAEEIAKAIGKAEYEKR